MMPEFTAEAALAGAGRHRYGRATINQSHPGIVPQQRETQLPDGRAAALAPAVACACPCCMTHACGFLGLSTCLTCCD